MALAEGSVASHLGSGPHSRDTHHGTEALPHLRMLCNTKHPGLVMTTEDESVVASLFSLTPVQLLRQVQPSR